MRKILFSFLSVQEAGGGGKVERHRLNMEFDLHTLFGLHVLVHSFTPWLRPRNPPAFGLMYSAYGAIHEANTGYVVFKRNIHGSAGKKDGGEGEGVG
jgi:hypothetical protein